MKKAQAGAIVILLVLVLAALIVIIALQVSDFSISSPLTGRVISTNLESSDVMTKDYDLSDFQKIRIEGKGDLFLTQGSEYSIKIEAEENVLDLLEVRLAGDTLTIGDKRNIVLTRKDINIFITMPEVEAITISGSGDIVTKDTVAGNNLDIALIGSGGADMDLEVANLETRISGSGGANYQGKTINHKISISGSGDVKALDLETENTQITISGSGDAEIHAENQLDIKIAGSGGVTYKGRPQISQSVSGSGSVRSI